MDVTNPLLIMGLLMVIFGGFVALLWYSQQRHQQRQTVPPLAQRYQRQPAAPEPAEKSLTRDEQIRRATIERLRVLPAQIPYPQWRQGAIPILFDGQRWHSIRLGTDGFWGVFGATGSGKGNALQHIALSALAMGPERVQLVVLDAKGGLDYSFCHRIAHAALYTDAAISEGCAVLLAEMERRKALLASVEARNISEYERKTGQQLPLMVIIADEIAEFARVAPGSDDALATFARQYRAMGGVLFVATQYPTAAVCSTQIQANVTNRLVFRLESSEHIPVALRREKRDLTARYDPSLIVRDLAGVGIARAAGIEVLGRAPELTDSMRDPWIDTLAECWPAVPVMAVPAENTTFEREAQELVPAGSPDTNAVNVQSEDSEANRLIKLLRQSDVSANKIAEVLGGRRADALERIRRVVGQGVQDA